MVFVNHILKNLLVFVAFANIVAWQCCGLFSDGVWVAVLGWQNNIAPYGWQDLFNDGVCQARGYQCWLGKAIVLCAGSVAFALVMFVCEGVVSHVSLVTQYCCAQLAWLL